MLDSILNFFSANQRLFFICGIASLALFLATLVFAPIVVLRLPADYFVRHIGKTREHSPGLFVARGLRNLLGTLLLLLGLVLLVLPGPGWLTILAGLAVADFPLKHKLELKILKIPSLRKAIDRHREKHNREPLRFPDNE